MQLNFKSGKKTTSQESSWVSKLGRHDRSKTPRLAKPSCHRVLQNEVFRLMASDPQSTLDGLPELMHNFLGVRWMVLSFKEEWFHVD